MYLVVTGLFWFGIEVKIEATHDKLGEKLKSNVYNYFLKMEIAK